MSYNILLNTNFNKSNCHWKLTNCKYENGYLSATDKIFSIEQEIVLPDPTKLYFSINYICFDKRIKSVYCGILTKDGRLEAVKKHPSLRKRKKLSLVHTVNDEKVKVLFIVESKISNSTIYIDSPLLIDLKVQEKTKWPKHLLDKCLHYRYGYDYKNEYPVSEIKLNSQDFRSPYTKTEEGNVGIIASIVENDWFRISHNFKKNRQYLVKLDYEQINEYGQIYLRYGELNSINIGKDQLYLYFKVEDINELRLEMENFEKLPYMINLKYIMILDVTDLRIGEDDIPYLPFI